MASKILVSLLAFTVLAYAQNQTDSTTQTASAESSELSIVKTIIEKSGLTDIKAEDVCTIENGKVVSLNLTNKDVAKDGITAIPPEIGQLTSLRNFTCNNNVITELPAEIGNCAELQVLILQSNRLTTLPGSIRNCINLVDLDLRHNQIENLPVEVVYLQKLTRLWLWGNKLTTLTEAITSLKSLKELYLKDNRLITLPVEITKMNLKYFDVIGNKICKPEKVLLDWLLKWDSRFVQTQKCW